MHRLAALAPSNVLRDGERQKSAHAMAKKSEWFIKPRDESGNHTRDKRFEPCDGRLHESGFPARKLDRTDLYVREQGRPPLPKNRGTRTGVRETEQANSCPMISCGV